MDKTGFATGYDPAVSIREMARRSYELSRIVRVRHPRNA